MRWGQCKECKQYSMVNAANARGRVEPGEYCSDCFERLSIETFADGEYLTLQKGTGGGKRIIRSGKELS